MLHFVLDLLKFCLVTAFEHRQVLLECFLCQLLSRGGFPVTPLRVALAPVAVRRVALRRGTGGFEVGEADDGGSAWTRRHIVLELREVDIAQRNGRHTPRRDRRVARSMAESLPVGLLLRLPAFHHSLKKYVRVR